MTKPKESADMKKLPTLREYFRNLFSKYQKLEITGIDLAEEFNKYEQFTDQPLELGQFIPCKSGVPFKEPSYELSGKNDGEEFNKYLVNAHKKALESVLFEGWSFDREIPKGRFRINKNGYWLDFESGEVQLSNEKRISTIEDLINSGIDLIPTKSCSDKLGL